MENTLSLISHGLYRLSPRSPNQKFYTCLKKISKLATQTVLAKLDLFFFSIHVTSLNLIAKMSVFLKKIFLSNTQRVSISLRFSIVVSSSPSIPHLFSQPSIRLVSCFFYSYFSSFSKLFLKKISPP